MRFTRVRIAASAVELPEERVPSGALEERLEPLYRRFGLSVGRLELMTGIAERRFWPLGTRPSAPAARAAERALAASGVARADVGALVHAAVCRDFLEPATASVVHHALGLGEECLAFDLSNACLGFANAMALLAGHIERGSLRAGLIVAAEDGRPLVEATLAALTTGAHVTKQDLKLSFASLTIGSGAAALVLAHDSLCPDAPALHTATSGAATEHHALCHGEHAQGAAGPLMRTDSEAMLHAGNALLARTWRRFEAESGWSPADVERVVTHQVGVQHKRLVLGTLGLAAERDFPTVERFGNVGSVSLPLSYTLARESGFSSGRERCVWLGIGSGLQCQILGTGR